MHQVPVSGLIPGPTEAARIAFRFDYEERKKAFRSAEWVATDPTSGRATALAAPLNADLLLHKFLPSDEELKQVIAHAEEPPFPGGHDELVKNAPDLLKHLRLQTWVRLANGERQVPGLRAWRERHEAGARVLKLRTAMRLLIGVGTPTPYEVGLTIHPLYGIPVVPGSSLKGIARSAVEPFVEEDDTVASLWTWMYGDSRPVLQTIQPRQGDRVRPLLNTLFGPYDIRAAEASASAGAVVFQDGWCIDTKDWYELDIVNPHYGDYYRDPPGPPSDRSEPTPVVFVVVQSGRHFHFPLRLAAWARGAEQAQRTLWLTLAEEILRFALTARGVGAKTGVGYGYFIA